jgi:ATP-dependent DNA helicase DinG
MDRLFLIHNLLKIHSDVHPERSRLSILKSDLLAFSLYRNAPKNREFGKETSQNSSLERATSVRGQGTSEDKNFEKEPTQPKTNSLDQFGIFSNALSEMIEMHIPGQIRLAIQLLDKAFQQWRSFLELHAKKDNLDGFKLRLKSPHSAHSFWNEHIVPASKSLAQQLSALGSSLLLLGKNLETFKDAPGFGKISNHILEIQSIAARINEAADFALHFISGEFASERIRWIEVFRNNIILFEASLDISAFCQSHLFSTQKSAILCSATLAAGGSFTYVKERLGLTKEISSQSIYDSPFDFASRSLFLVPTDLPFPNAPDYFPQHIFTIEQAIEKSRGSVFVLFTSYDMLSQCYDALSSGALSRKYPFLRQGELPRHVLLQKFKSREASVLFGTDSFWEGVDVPGEALRCVIISKLPFPVPSEPFYEAHAEVMEKEGKDSFLHYAIPLAVIKFKQGFGRLLRTKKDRGCILCLDPRLAKKNYGKHFLNSLPPSRTFFDSRDKVLAEMERFYHF